MWSYNLKVAAAPPKEKQQRAEIERCKLELANERNEMRLVAAARVGIAALETRAAENSPVQRMVGRRKLEPRVSEAKRWAVEGTCFGLNWIEVERASHATKKAALADMRAIAKKMPHLQLRVVEVVERRDVIARSGAKPPNDELCGGGPAARPIGD
jgi:hypothetical protein